MFLTKFREGRRGSVKELFTGVRNAADNLGLWAGVMDYVRAGESPLIVSTAIMHAARAFSRGRNIGKTFDSEVMRYASGQRRISAALTDVGVSGESREIVFFAVERDHGEQEDPGIYKDDAAFREFIHALAELGFGDGRLLATDTDGREPSETERELLERMALMEVNN